MPDRAHLSFALSLHDAVAPDRTRNAVWSPYSVASALGMVAHAARGETRRELDALLGAGNADLLRDSDVGTVGDDAEFAVANTLWAWDALPLEDGFLAELARWPGGQVRSAPFADDPEGARKLINADVADTTRGLIPDLLPPGAVKSDTVASLVNALYLKCAWNEEFPVHDTTPRPFRGAGEVETMRLEATLRHGTAPGWEAVAIPAHGGVEAVVLLPDDVLGDLAGVPAALESLERHRIELFLPKLALTVPTTLGAPLREVGVRTLFTRDADLTGLSPDPRLYVDEVLHEAVLRLDEQGFEGAAATAVMMRLTSIVEHPPARTVRVDRPHLLLVRHERTGAIYFLAQVVAP
ncbi:serpin family protein [Actinosynnema sp. NPDC047251]|uniref:Proteinase inhibitor, I4 serpin n=1 Tax=Saccharothrix espanaensis (strain ATCC 51144 / DSM 44229 / JCM 9112 / NBRC 15066 / NRRL 15764) TaxID=1179773 RepID=K0JPK2_SACES|nr:serpin family protein [Saccharothrix espanaensis]CCH28845.1 Proteinase inhibitor, I4 serpin [Saccharothrix espanaensis DSM 44229]